jgi:hypothetical protein
LKKENDAPTTARRLRHWVNLFMNFTLIDIFSYAVAIAAVIGLVRIRHIDQVYYPFILLLWIAVANEVIGTILIATIHTNAINSNLYVLLESLLLVIFFNRLQLFPRKSIFYFFLFTFAAAWIVENLLIFRITTFHSYFRVLYSFITVLMSIHMINKLLTAEQRGLARNSVFLVMIGFIIYFTYKALVEIFWIYGLNSSTAFRIDVYRIMVFVNLTVNIIFALAVLWIPRKRVYTLL